MGLSQWAQVLEIDPLHFAGATSRVRPCVACREQWVQHAWVTGGRVAGREEVAAAIAIAESQIAHLCGFWPGRVWVADRVPFRQGTFHRNTYCWSPILKATWGYIVQPGAYSATYLGTAEGVGSDDDDDGFAEWMIFTLPVAGEPTEIRLFFAQDDRSVPGTEDTDSAWEIRPVRWSYAGGLLTMYIHTWEIIRPQVVEVQQEPIDIDDPSNLASEVLVYSVAADTDYQAAVLGSGVCDSSSYSTTFSIRNGRAGIIEVNTIGGYAPDEVMLYYQCGLSQTIRGLVGAQWARWISILATAHLNWPLCGCSNVAAWSDYWRAEVDEGCPWGTRRGHVVVWNELCQSRHILGRGVMV